MNFLRILALITSFLAAIFNAFIAMGYIYVSFSSALGIVLGTFMSLSGFIITGITLCNTLIKDAPKKEMTETTIKKQQLIANILLIIAIPNILLNTVSVSFSTYQSLMLLAVALSLSIPPPILIGIAAVIAGIIGISAFAYACVQTDELWHKINASLPIAATTDKKANSIIHEKEIPLNLAFQPQEPSMNFSYKPMFHQTSASPSANPRISSQTSANTGAKLQRSYSF